MNKPIYAGPRTGKRRSRWRNVFIGVILIQFILLGLYLYQGKRTPNAVPIEPIIATPSTLPSIKDSVTSLPLESPTTPAVINQVQAIQHALSNEDVQQAHALIQPLLNQPNLTIIDLMGQINMRRLLSSQPMEGKKLYKMNFLKHKNKLNNTWWEANTGIIVLDDIIKNINRYAYAHHIERLMYLGNILLMLMVDPKEVHRIFMEWTVDSYDWVMVPNIMGMSQYSDGGIMMTRPYFASSNYISKMSTYKKNKKNVWHQEWDAIYYNFINKHQDMLRKNYATSRMVLHWDKKTDNDKNNTVKLAKKVKKRLLI